MKLWKDNLISGEYEMTPAEVAKGFLASKWNDQQWLLRRALLVYIGEHDDGLGSAVSTPEPELDEVEDLVIAAWQAAR